MIDESCTRINSCDNIVQVGIIVSLYTASIFRFDVEASLRNFLQIRLSSNK